MKDSLLRASGWTELQTPLLSMQDAGGEPRVWPGQWFGLVCNPTPGLLMAVPEPPGGPVAPGVHMRFAVSLPPVGCRVPSSLVAMLSGAGEDLLAQAGLQLTAGTLPGLRLVAGWPLQFECRQGRSVQRSGLVLLRGEVAAIHCDGQILAEEQWADFCRAPIRDLLRREGVCNELAQGPSSP